MKRTPDSFIINLNDKDDDFLFATERYDRKILDTSKELMGKKVPLRLHQEDFAQALEQSTYELENQGYGVAVDIQKQILKKAGIHNFKLTNS